jgi:hypothetical protein
MKKYIRSIFTFVPFCIIIYVILVCAWGELVPQFFKPNLYHELGSYGHLNTRVKEATNIKNIDILFLGSSSAYRGFDTRIYAKEGISTFNFGSSAQSPIQTKVLLNRHLDQLNPKLIIFEVNPLIFSNDGVESSLDLIANEKNDMQTLEMLASTKHIKTLNATIFGFYSNFLHRNEGFVEKIKIDQDSYVPGGFVEKELAFYKPKKHQSQELKIKNYQLDAFKEILDILSKKKIEFILVRAPITKSMNQSYTNKEDFDKMMSSYGSYHNFNKTINLIDSVHFYDKYHMNQNGVKIFNHKLIETLKLK